MPPSANNLIFMNLMKKLSKLIFTGLALGAAFSVQAETRAVIDTDMGRIELALDEKKAPKTVANFTGYANKGFYNGTIFHRVTDGFMIQGGGFTPDMVQKATGKAVANEADNGLKNTIGTIAMARTANPNSATSQFFINTVDNSKTLDPVVLPAGDPVTFEFRGQIQKDIPRKNVEGHPLLAGYTVFGKVVSGMDVVHKIAKVKTTDQAYHQNIPVRPVVIRNVTIEKQVSSSSNRR